MIRYAPIALVALSLFAGIARAAEENKYAVTADAFRAGDAILLSLKVTRTGASDDPTVKEKVTTTLTMPKIKLGDGQRGFVVTGKALPKADGTPPADPSEISSGCKIDAISIKGSDHLLVIATFVEDGLTVWADAITVKIAAGPAGAKH